MCQRLWQGVRTTFQSAGAYSFMIPWNEWCATLWSLICLIIEHNMQLNDFKFLDHMSQVLIVVSTCSFNGFSPSRDGISLVEINMPHANQHPKNICFVRHHVLERKLRSMVEMLVQLPTSHGHFSVSYVNVLSIWSATYGHWQTLSRL